MPKLANTVVSAFSVKLHVPVPEQVPPLQPVKLLDCVPTALRVTTVPVFNVSLQVDTDVPQVMPPLRVTVPLPSLETVKVFLVLTAVKVAMTVLGASMVTVQAPVPLQLPPQPVKL